MELLAGAPLPDWPHLEATRRWRVLEPGETVYGDGGTDTHLYLVRSGMVLGQASLDGGEFVTIDLFAEGDLLAHLEPEFDSFWFHRLVEFGFLGRLDQARLLTQGRVATRAVAIEVTDLIGYDLRVMHRLADHHVVWSRALLAAQYLNALTFTVELLRHRLQTPAERHADLLAERPDLARRLLHKDLAGYLGISESGYSRMLRAPQE